MLRSDMADRFAFQSILITGASSGLGAALAMRLAGPGVTLTLTGRREDSLRAVAKTCTDAGAGVTPAVVDVRDARTMASTVSDADRRRPLDLVIANAGISGGTGSSGETEAQAREIFATNVDGVLNTVLPALPPMKSRGGGHIAVMSSLAGFRRLPTAPAYAASKAAVKSWGEGLRGALAPDGIGVSVICPGFFESGITAANDFHMPFLMPSDRAAEIISRGLMRNKGRIAFPWPMVFGVWLLDALPDFVGDAMARHLPAKPEMNP
jgi:short-subunit dehydrogenase